MHDTPEHRWLLTRLVAQEVRRDGEIPHFSAGGVQAVLEAASQRAGQPGTLSCHFRELGGLIRIAATLLCVRTQRWSRLAVRMALSGVAPLKNR